MAKVGPWFSTKHGSDNSCAARLSYGLNYGGLEIENAPQFQSHRNDDNKRYILSAEKLRAYLRHHWGTPDFTFPGTAGQNIADLRLHLAGGKVAIVNYNGHVGCHVDEPRPVHALQSRGRCVDSVVAAHPGYFQAKIGTPSW